MAYHAGYCPENVRGEIFYVSPRYTDLRYINEGTYGVVCSAVDNLRRERVAIKKIKLFNHERSGSKTLREIVMLSRFSHDNVISILDIVSAPRNCPSQEIYLVLTLMDTDLWRLLKTRRLPREHIACFLYQILRGLKYIHSANVVHLDLKPGNILVNSQCFVKICDFGLARVISPEEQDNNKFNKYVVTRGYRAPEIILHSYTIVSKAVDIWSVGCILAEMLTSRPLFRRKHYLDELNSIFSVIGSPTTEELNCIKKVESKEFVASLPRKPKLALSLLFPTTDNLTLDLLERMIHFVPSHRITAEQALDHPFFMRYHDPSNEPVVSQPFKTDDEFDNSSPEEIKALIGQQTARYNGHLR